MTDILDALERMLPLLRELARVYLRSHPNAISSQQSFQDLKLDGDLDRILWPTVFQLALAEQQVTRLQHKVRQLETSRSDSDQQPTDKSQQIVRPNKLREQSFQQKRRRCVIQEQLQS